LLSLWPCPHSVQVSFLHKEPDLRRASFLKLGPILLGACHPRLARRGR
jgi:hypothetical protein